MDTDAVVLLVIAVTSLLAMFFTIVPVLPGTLLVPLGALACGWIAGFDEFAWWFWVAQGVLVLVVLAFDQVIQVLGLRRAGASRQAMWGGAIGTIVGPFLLLGIIGPFAILFGPPMGAVAGTIIGEEFARTRATREGTPAIEGRDHRRLGIAALVAYAVGTGVKLAFVAVQVALLFLVVR